MQVKKVDQNLYEIKSKEAILTLDGGIKVGDIEISSPGEYEIGGIFITGIASLEQTIFTLEVEDMNLCFLAKLQKPLTTEALDEIQNIDILFLPVGGEGTLGAKEASSLLQKIDPKVVIPIYLEDEAAFLKEEGEANPRREKVLKIVANQLPEEERELIILE